MPDGRVRHGLSNHPLYGRWIGMRQRCNDRGHKNHSQYGGRGIRVCPRWDDFGAFLKDMGEAPPGASLDRIDRDGDYSPDNCRWATQTQQMRNMSRNRMIEFRGERLCVKEWAGRLGINESSLRERLEKWPLADALCVRKLPNKGRAKNAKV